MTVRSQKRSALARSAIALAVAVLGLAYAVPSEARWRSGDPSPQTLNVPDLSADDDTPRVCQDGVRFEFAVIPSLGDDHPHVRPPGSPDSRSYRFVVSESSGGSIVVDQLLAVPYNPVDVFGDSSSPLAHRDYSGTFTLTWSPDLAPGTSVDLEIFAEGSPTGSFLQFDIQDCHLPAQPPGCGEVIAEDTKLQADLVDCLEGIVIGADDITLDLNGHTIDGIGGGKGIRNSGAYQDVTIENGTIKEFETGVELTGARDNRVRRLTLTNNEDGILLLSSSGNRVEQNRAISNDISGIVLAGSDRNRVQANVASGNQEGGTAFGFGGGIELVESNRNKITGNVASGNSVGISLRSGDSGEIPSTDNEIKGNTASGNTEAGIELVVSEGNKVEDNVASNNGVSDGFFDDTGGIILASSPRNQVEDNTVSGNGEVGIHIGDGSDGNRVEDNTASMNGLSGIRVRSSDNRVERNAAFRNGEAGIRLSGSRNQVNRNSSSNNLVGIELVDEFFDGADDNRLTRNIATGNQEDGIRVASQADGTVLERNIASLNLDDGIDVDNASALTRLTRNTANDNLDLGIEAESGVTDGGGNRARGNGNAAQCTGVTCT